MRANFIFFSLPFEVSYSVKHSISLSFSLAPFLLRSNSPIPSPGPPLFLSLNCMSGASVIFYGRRSRSTRSFDDLGFRGSTSSSSSSSSSSSDRGSQHHRCRKTDLHRRCRGNHSLDEFPRPLLVRQPVVVISTSFC